MSLASVRPFFRTRLEGLGYTEHDQPFEPDEVGANIVDDAFHLETGSIAGAAANQMVHGFLYPITVRIYKVGYQNLNDAYDESMEIADTILADILQPSVRLSTVIKNITPESIQPLPLSSTNDNVIVLTLAFTAELQLCF